MHRYALLATCLTVAFLVFMFPGDRPRDFAYLAGYSLMMALLVSVVFMLIFGRKQGKAFGGVAFLAIYLTLLASAYVAATHRKAPTRQELAATASSLKSDLDHVFNTQTDSKGLPQRMEPVAATGTAKGELGEMERYMKSVVNMTIAARNDYLAELDAIGWSNILDAERLKNDHSFAESQNMLRRVKEIIVKYRAKSASHQKEARSGIDALALSESQKNSMRAGFDRSSSESAKRITAMWDLEEQVVKEFDNLIALLSSTRRNWTVSEGNIAFTEQSDLDQFNAYLDNVKKLTEKQEAIQRQTLSSTKDSIDKMKQ